MQSLAWRLGSFGLLQYVKEDIARARVFNASLPQRSILIAVVLFVRSLHVSCVRSHVAVLTSALWLGQQTRFECPFELAIQLARQSRESRVHAILRFVALGVALGPPSARTATLILWSLRAYSTQNPKKSLGVRTCFTLATTMGQKHLG